MFAERITVSTSNEQPFIDIVARADEGPEAQQIADSVARQLLMIAATVGTDDELVRSFVEEDMAAIQTQITQIRAEIATLVADTTRTVAQQTRLETLEDRLVDLRGTYAALLQTPTRSESNRLTVIDPANEPPEPASPRPLFNTVDRGAAGAAGRDRRRVRLGEARRSRQDAGGRRARHGPRDHRADRSDAGRDATASRSIGSRPCSTRDRPPRRPSERCGRTSSSRPSTSCSGRS